MPRGSLDMMNPGTLRDSQADISLDHRTEESGIQGEQTGNGSHPCQVGMGHSFLSSSCEESDGPCSLPPLLFISVE